MAYTITDADAQELITIATALVGVQVQKGLIVPAEKEDYVQELLLSMVKAQDFLIIPEGKTLGEFAMVVMGRDLIDLWRANHAQCFVPAHSFSLNEKFEDEDGAPQELIENVSGKEGFSDAQSIIDAEKRRLRILDVRNFLKTRPPDELELCTLLMSRSHREIGQLIGRDKVVVARRIEKIRVKMIAAGLSENF